MTHSHRFVFNSMRKISVEIACNSGHSDGANGAAIWPKEGYGSAEDILLIRLLCAAKAPFVGVGEQHLRRLCMGR